MAAFGKQSIKFQKSMFRISSRSPTLRYNFIGSAEKDFQLLSLFRARIKNKLIAFEHENTFSQYFSQINAILTPYYSKGNISLFIALLELVDV